MSESESVFHLLNTLSKITNISCELTKTDMDGCEGWGVPFHVINDRHLFALVTVLRAV